MSKVQRVKLEDLKPNPDNPRKISKNGLAKLKKSIKEFEEMLELRPIIINKDNLILAGNQRYQACVELGIKDVPVSRVRMSKKKQAELMIRDNVSFGQWDWEDLMNNWEVDELEGWGMEVWDSGRGKEGFDPETNPSFDSDEVTPEDVDKADITPKKSERVFLDCDCPTCGHKFQIEK